MVADPGRGVTGVLRERRGPVAWITLNRPRELNALDDAVLEQLGAALGEAEADPAVRCVVLTGAGRAFCAGADLRFVQALPVERRDVETAAFLGRASALMSRLEAFPRPVIAAVNGVAVAGGLELLLCADLVVAAEGARIGDGHANYGLLPGAGGSARLPRRVGMTRAKHLFFTGDLLPAAELVAAGLVNSVVPDAELPAAVGQLATKIAARSPAGLRRMKELANASADSTLDEALRRELAVNEDYALTFDRNEGLAAFNENRQPVFQGR